MGVISIEQTDRLYWLGRYTERVYTTVRLFFVAYDTIIDQNSMEHSDFCKRLDIPDIYKDGDDFCRRYAFDETDENSLISNLKRAYDNAIVLREEISSEALSYIQLAIYEIQKASVSDAPIMELQKVLDNLIAFCGICDDRIENENVRNILKVGKRIERIDLYGRLHKCRKKLECEVKRLEAKIKNCDLKYRKGQLDKLGKLVQDDELDYHEIVLTVEQLLK